MAKLYFRYSAMNAGKSTYLLQVAHNYEEQGQSVRLFTAGIDDRFGACKITSRLGLQREAQVFDADFDFLEAAQTWASAPACVLLDEAQFLGAHQVRQLHRLAAQQGVPVLCFGLRSDFRGMPFEGSAHLLALADDLEEIKTICRCGKKATMNMRFDKEGRMVRDGAQIEVGGESRYRQVCAGCFFREAEAAASAVCALSTHEGKN
jgi:thymidine kinase